EIWELLRRLKSGGAPGIDRVPVSSLKTGKDSVSPPLTNLLNNIVKTGCIPKAMGHANTILIHKQGDVTDVGNYRPISLLSSILKTLTKAIANRLGHGEGGLYSKLPMEQAGFRPGHSTTEHIHALNMVAEKCYEFDIPLVAVFIDFRKAFDSIDYMAIWEALSFYGIEQKWIDTIKMIYAQGSSAVRLDNLLAEFDVQRGVRQGDSLSPLLFITTLQHALHGIDWKDYGIKINGSLISYLAYADDIVLL
uniref:Reverse transcriptase domain-containing protein n=1 Tax=Steinernema glaseri TaxID=37863 RepID=A0A1I7Y1J0_9BILA